MSDTFPTSSQTGTLYFGYGSNLSPFQMAGRCPASGIPIAIARLNSWSWLITERGTANIIPMRPAPTSFDTHATTVWGVLYNLTPNDEAALDRCEGHSPRVRGPKNPDLRQQPWKPYQQGRAVYNKLYLPVKIEKWLVEDPVAALGISESEFSSHIVRSLIYIDEYSLHPGRIKQPYVRRMGRAARECIPLGVPEEWIRCVFSQHGIDKDDPKSYTDDIAPGDDSSTLPDLDWESLRQQFLIDEAIERA